MNRRQWALGLALVSLGSLGWASEPVPFRTVAQGPDGPVLPSPTRRVLRSARDVARLYPLERAAPGASQVDFERDMLLFVSLGRRTERNATVEVEWVHRTVRADGTGSLMVGVRERVPEGDDPRELGRSAPFHLVRLAAYPNDVVHIATWRSRTGRTPPTSRLVYGEVRAEFPKVTIVRRGHADLHVAREEDRVSLRRFHREWVTLEASRDGARVTRVDRLLSPTYRTLRARPTRAGFHSTLDLRAIYAAPGAEAVPTSGADSALAQVKRGHQALLEGWVFTTLNGRPFKVRVERIAARGNDRSRLLAPRFDQRVWVVGQRLNSSSLWVEYSDGSRSYADSRFLQVGESPQNPWSRREPARSGFSKLLDGIAR